jgi:hypothetical protein
LKNSIHAAFLAATLVMSVAIGAQRLTTDQAYELKGETPGTTTLTQFKANHKHADCRDVTAHQTTCRVYDGVTFAGVVAHSSKGCATSECLAQGIFADFVDHKLVSLMYGVSPVEDAVLPALKAKFGEPMKDGDGFVWKNSVGTLSFGITSIWDSNGAVKLTATVIRSSLNNKGVNKDI